MSDGLRHRGPDQSGFYIDPIVSLGHRRLSILDLTRKGRQPMSYKNLVITYNGEIYNFSELKDELEGLGHRFTSTSDTEVILHSYSEWGMDCVNRFNGMWAFCIYDKKKKELFLSRDRFGIKPLYYYAKHSEFIFASELKAIKSIRKDQKTDMLAVNNFFYQKYISGDRTIYSDCKRLLPGQNLLYVLKQNSMTLSRYYRLEDEINESRNIPTQTRIKYIRKLIRNSITARLIADVPVGTFLSGGLDSSIITALTKQQKKDLMTFSIGFKDESYNELSFADIAAEHIGTKHIYEYVDTDDKLIEEVLSYMDEPFGDPSLIPTYQLSKIARKHVTVALSGDGADEVFGGYDSYKGYKISSLFPSFLKKLVSPVRYLIPSSDKKMNLEFMADKFLSSQYQNPVKRHSSWMGVFENKERKILLGKDFRTNNSFMSYAKGKSLRSVQLQDIHNYLAEDTLRKTDMASMYNSLEVRVPFLDYRIVPLVLSLPCKFRVRKFTTKWLLKDFGRTVLPKTIVDRKKRGFTLPIAHWIRNSKLIKDYILDNKYYNNGILMRKYVLKLFNDHMKHRKDNSRQLWLVFIFNYFYAKEIMKSRGTS